MHDTPSRAGLAPLTLILCSIALLSGCGGGGGKDASTSTNSPANYGTALDGYLEKAMVCADANNNMVCDSNEPNVLTSANGQFNVDELLAKANQEAEGADKDAAVAAVQECRLVIETTADTRDSDYPDEVIDPPFVLLAHKNSNNRCIASPLSTLLSGLTRNGLSQDEALTQLATLMGIDAEQTRHLVDSDYIKAKDDQDKDTAEQAEKAHQIAKVTAKTLAMLLEPNQQADPESNPEADQEAKSKELALQANRRNEIITTLSNKMGSDSRITDYVLAQTSEQSSSNALDQVADQIQKDFKSEIEQRLTSDAVVKPAKPLWDNWMAGVGDNGMAGQVVAGKPFTLSWSKWSGKLGDHWVLTQTKGGTETIIDDLLVVTKSTWDDWSTNPVTKNGLGGQTGAHEFANGMEAGKYTFVAELCNAAGACNQSETLNITVVAAVVDAGGTGTTAPAPTEPTERPKTPIKPPAQNPEPAPQNPNPEQPVASGVKPATPSIEYIDGEWKGYFTPGEAITVKAVKWWGADASSWQLWVNGDQVTVSNSGAFEKSGAMQRAVASYTPNALGEGEKIRHEDLQFKFCNKDNCATSAVKTIKIAMAAPEAPITTAPPPPPAPPAAGTGDNGQTTGPSETGTLPDVTGESSAEMLKAEEDYIASKLSQSQRNALTRARASRTLLDGISNIDTLPKMKYNEVTKKWEDTSTGRSGNSYDNVNRVARILSAEDFNAHFDPAYINKYAPIDPDTGKPRQTYSYEGLLNAVAVYPKFCGDEKADDNNRSTDDLCRLALATTFAHFTQEVGAHAPVAANADVQEWQQGLAYVNEAGCSNTGAGCGYDSSCTASQWTGEIWICPGYGTSEGKKYFGRGAKQLSYNYNYARFSRQIFGNEKVLLEDPDLVARTPSLAMLSALFFFMEPQPPKPSMYDVIHGYWKPSQRDLDEGRKPGFGLTTLIINGGVECGGSVEVAQSVNRIKYFEGHATELGIWDSLGLANEVLGCAGMLAFDGNSGDTFPLYWERDWSKPNKCQLVNYEAGPFSAFYPGDYESCVYYHFDRAKYDKYFHPFKGTDLLTNLRK